MKNIIIVFILVLSAFTCSAQYEGLYQFKEPTPANEVKKPFNYILQYRTWTYKPTGNFSSTSFKEWVNYIEGFYTKEEMIEWINTPDIYFHGMVATRISENEFIAAYDLRTMKEIKIKFKTKTTVKEKQIVIEKEERTDTWWEIQ